MKKILLIGGVLAIALAYVVFRLSGERRTPPGQPPLATLNVEEFQRLFNSSADETRLLVLLSPT